MAGTVLLLGATDSFGTKDLPAPQATLMKTIIEGVLSGALPWGLVLTGGGLALAATLCGVSGLAFAIGVYLPLASMTPIFVGGCARWLAERRFGAPKAGEAHPGVLAASGVVAGKGLAGVLVAALIALSLAPKSLPPRLGGVAAQLGTLILLTLTCAILYRAASQMKTERPRG